MFHEFFFLQREDKKISDYSKHSLPTLLPAEKCTRSSSCVNREVLFWTTTEVKKTRVFLSTRQCVNKAPCASLRSAPQAASRLKVTLAALPIPPVIENTSDVKEPCSTSQIRCWDCRRFSFSWRRYTALGPVVR